MHRSRENGKATKEERTGAPEAATLCVGGPQRGREVEGWSSEQEAGVW